MLTHLCFKGVLNRAGCLDDMEELKKNLAPVAASFFKEVFNPSVRNLPPNLRTRKHNVAQSGVHYLPKVFRIYPEDVAILSANVKNLLQTRRRDATFTFYFSYLKYGQQQVLHTPLSIRSANLHLVVARLDLVEFSSCHFAATMTHNDNVSSVCWDLDKTAQFLRSRDKVTKYPLMGLGEIGNVTSSSPEVKEKVNTHNYYTRNFKLTSLTGPICSGCLAQQCP